MIPSDLKYSQLFVDIFATAVGSEAEGSRLGLYFPFLNEVLDAFYCIGFFVEEVNPGGASFVVNQAKVVVRFSEGLY